MDAADESLAQRIAQALKSALNWRLQIRRLSMRFVRWATLAVALGCSGVHAANLGAPAAKSSDMGKAQTQIEQNDWPAAVARLEKYVKDNPKDADGFNLLGYSLRQLKRYPEAIQHYNEALRLDPQHRGAHDYLGQAYVQLKEMDKARELLASLEKICGLQCEQYLSLKKAIDNAAKH
jgi:tetratricopeptide (TPR) repeat protein